MCQNTHSLFYMQSRFLQHILSATDKCMNKDVLWAVLKENALRLAFHFLYYFCSSIKLKKHASNNSIKWKGTASL